MKSNSVMEFAYDAPSRTLSWLFKDGGVVEYTHADVTPIDSLTIPAIVRGFKQKIGDAAATDMGTPMAEKRAAMLVVVATLNAGQWNAERAGGGNAGGLLATAIANVKRMEIEKVRAFLKGKTKAQRDAFAAKEDYATEIQRLTALRIAGVDTSGMEDELDGLADEE